MDSKIFREWNSIFPFVLGEFVTLSRSSLLTADRCVDDSLLLLLNWQDDIPSQMDLTTSERYHLRESLICLLKISLQCTQIALDPQTLSSSFFPSCRDTVVSVLFHSILDFVPWLQNEVHPLCSPSPHLTSSPLTLLSSDLSSPLTLTLGTVSI
jgi:hypothetical protein